MATTADIRNGLCIELNNDIMKVIDFQRFQVGRGSGKVWTKLKSTTTGKIIEHTFQSGHTITEVRVERRKFQYLYPEGDSYVLMNQETYDQITVPSEMIENARFLKEGDTVDVLYHAQKEIPLSVEMPPNVVLQITYTEPGVRGDTATNTLKPATVETGAEVRVPLFCETGEYIRIDTATGEYIERVKK
ncbi:MAG: elongation factor P [Saprospiraceae bacterium]|nr:elongation factor P [Saprospiraceae bacterium]MDW8230584.1 elongation factor P [Saprospiraceae bacterium]